jgi:FMN-dependent oxidoreductase (nitrilotriacetate monooxygenase family)
MSRASSSKREDRGQLKLGAFMYPAGHHVAAWRHPNVSAFATTDFAYRAAFAKKAEAAKFDLIFLADGVGVADERSNILSRSDEWSIGFEPVTLLSALSVVTERIGLVATASTTFHEPYNIARFFASLDQLSAGRAGWNLVTSSNELEARNFSGLPHLRHAERYDRANEFIDVVLGLWNSWEDDAFVRDKQSGRFFDPDKLHVLDHHGSHFNVRGPLNVSRSPQGHPVVVQAGSSDVGQELAARTAEIVFTAQRTLAEAQKFYADLKGRLAKYGRAPDDLKIMPGVFPVVGRSEAEAREKFEQLQDLIHPEIGLALLSNYIGKFDLSAYRLDGPLPDLPVTNASQSRQQLLVDLARRENLTIRQLYLRVAGARGHWQLIGTPAQIVDELEERFLNLGADGFNIMPPTVPGGLDDFIELVIPELRRRGLFRSEYEGRTLRENLGLKFQIHQPHDHLRHGRQAAE